MNFETLGTDFGYPEEKRLTRITTMSRIPTFGFVQADIGFNGRFSQYIYTFFKFSTSFVKRKLLNLIYHVRVSKIGKVKSHLLANETQQYLSLSSRRDCRDDQGSGVDVLPSKMIISGCTARHLFYPNCMKQCYYSLCRIRRYMGQNAFID